MAKAPTTAGYSGTPLVNKLGIKPGESVYAVNAPADYAAFLGPLPAGAAISQKPDKQAGFIHYFATTSADLHTKLPQLKKLLRPNGMLWVSWPKKAAAKLHGIVTDVTEDTVRNEALAIGLVDVKVCAVTEVWSGLKLVIPVQNRK
jgi:hypothetical protein